MVAIPQVGHGASSPGILLYAGRFEITWRQYLFAVRQGACPIPKDGNNQDYDVNDKRINDEYPLTTVGLDTFSCYTQWISQMTGHRYRIPTAQEWEHLARAGTREEYYWGNGLGLNNAVVIDHFDFKKIQKTTQDTTRFFRDDRRVDVKFKLVYPVGILRPNPWGLYDVIGNAAEFTTEKSAPSSLCLRTRKAAVCDMINVRGNDRGRIPNPMTPNPPITVSYMTERFTAPAHGGVSRAGFRLVRD
jgi:formylglycine-generating enzyme required for sulfatase activity